MNKDEFLKELSEVLELEQIPKEDIKLENIATWDSLSKLFIMQILDRNYNISISIDEINKLKTIGDIMALLNR